MSLLFSFLSVATIFWIGAVYLLKLPVKLASPWPGDHRLNLENLETLVYLSAVILIPVLAAALSWMIDKKRKREPPPEPSRPWISMLWFVVPVFVYFIHLNCGRSMLNQPLEYLDDGIRLAAANQYRHGARPYSEMLLDYGPGIEIAQPLLAFKLFGQTLSAHRRLEWLIDPLGPAAACLLLLLALRRRVFIILFFLILIGRDDIWLSPRATLPLLSLCCLTASFRVEREKIRLLWTAFGGVFCGLAFFYSMEGGLLLGAALSAFFFLKFIRDKKWKDIVAFSGGGLLVAAGVALWLGRIDDILHIPGNTVQIVHILKDAYGKPTPPLVAPLVQWIKNPLIVFGTAEGSYQRWWFPVFFMMAGLTLYWKAYFQGRTLPWTFFMCLWSGALFFLIAIGRSDYEHWLKGTPLFWVTVVMAVDLLLSRFSLKRSGAVLFLAAYIFAQLNFSKAWENIFCRISNVSELTTDENAALDRLGALPLSTDEKNKTENIVRRLRYHAGGAGGSAYLFHDYCLYYFLADVVNPTRYAVSSWILGSMNDEVISDLQNKKPACIMALEEDGALIHTVRSEKVAQFISAHYEVVDRWENFVFLKQKK